MSKSASDLVWDYLVFFIFVIASTFVAIYSRFVEGKQKTKADFVFAAGRVSMGAMMMSIARGTLGVRSVLGYPSELFYRGAPMWETLYGMILAYPIVCYVFIPVYYSLGITSVYQYLDLRFKSRLVRCLACATYVLRQIFNQGITVYTPCVALYTIIGIPYWASILGITLISIFFTLLGGLKAAILADVMQGITIIAISVLFIIQGTINAGGVYNVFKTNIEGGRLNFFNWSLDPTIRVTTLSATIGQLFMSLSILGCQQNFVQRYCSMESQKKITKTLMLNIPVITILFSISWLVGMVIYAVYASCDPLSAGYTDKYDEVLPFFVEDKFNYFPGILGLFIASLFNSSLTLNVSILNSLATCTFEDFIKPLPWLKGMSEKNQLYSIKATAVVIGFLIMGISFGVGLFSGVIESSMLVTSATSGPLLGVFILAMLVPCCNWKGAASGVIMGHMITLWILIGGLTIEKPPTKLLPVSTDGCTNETFSQAISKIHIEPMTTILPVTESIIVNNTADLFETFTTRAESIDPLTYLYSTTYMYYSAIGCFVTLFVGITVSCVTGLSKDEIYDDNLIHPIARKIASWFPGQKRLYSEKYKNVDDNRSLGNGFTLTLQDEIKKNGKLNPTFTDCRKRDSIESLPSPGKSDKDNSKDSEHTPSPGSAGSSNLAFEADNEVTKTRL
ncbi:sodium-coupled monocarboxylate transporter 2 [Agrilus planipennis]|uniref:Sodium-coupled monocarboxylate transporter 2 n=1 Tax=Agrilus planipennis TaxID=224129 RepID=A0A1W4X697_AGRPL|nr:sodium-coupled monocarboxylate transporter 2 [Agrilus planipennis]XP_018327908.1 sodium-coupled monocarboxylate transporter 2 [Agrilus planipennis]XP_025832501.1 sodium-coupled monocarboxylate transporter 2 [Agrilus planipennis]